MVEDQSIEIEVFLLDTDKEEYPHFYNLLKTQIEEELGTESDVDIIDKESEEYIEGSQAIGEVIIGLVVKKISEKIVSKIFNSFKNYLSREETPKKIRIRMCGNGMDLEGDLTKNDYKLLNNFINSNCI